MSNDNNTTSDQQSVIVATDEDQAVIKGALRASGIVDFAPKEENMSINSSEGEQATDLDENWLSDFEMVINTTTMNNNTNMDKQIMIGQDRSSSFTPKSQDGYNDFTSTGTTSLLDKYLSHKNLQNQQQMLQHQHSTEIDNEEFDSYFNELFPDLAL